MREMWELRAEAEAELARQVQAGGKPKTSTPADKRLKENRQPPKPTASRSTMPKVMPKTPKRK
jgi:hypothetical protein